MGIFRRMRDIVTANLHEMADRFENPQTMLKQAIREMENAIARSLARAAAVVTSEKLLERNQAEQLEHAEKWQSGAEAAVARGDDNLAREALLEKRRCGSLADALRDERNALRETGEKLRRRIAAMRAKLSEARRLELALIARSQAAVATKGLTNLCACGDLETGFSRFDRMRFQIERAETYSEARFALLDDPWQTSMREEFERHEQEAADAELEALKRGAQSS